MYHSPSLDSFITDVEQDRLDILVLGNRAAGKTMFIASLLHYLKCNPDFNIESDSQSGASLAEFMIGLINENKLSGRLPKGCFVNIPFDVNNSYYNIIKTEGNNGIRSLPMIMDRVNKSSNPRVVLITIPIDELVVTWSNLMQDKDGNISSHQSEMLISGFYSSIMHKLANNKILDKAIGVGIVLTKWDKAKACGYSSVDNFMERRCKTLQNTIIDIMNNTGGYFEYKVFKHSIGRDFDEATGGYASEPIGNLEIFNWIKSLTLNKIVTNATSI